MTQIALGTIQLRQGMTMEEAKFRDEQIKKANHGQQPTDKNGKILKTNVNLFIQYDADKNGIISENEYQKYKQDMAKNFNDMINNTKKEIKIFKLPNIKINK